MTSDRCPRASAICIGVGSPSQGRIASVGPLGRVTSFRPLRRLIWMGTEMVSRPSLAGMTCGAPVLLIRVT